MSETQIKQWLSGLDRLALHAIDASDHSRHRGGDFHDGPAGTLDDHARQRHSAVEGLQFDAGQLHTDIRLSLRAELNGLRLVVPVVKCRRGLRRFGMFLAAVRSMVVAVFRFGRRGPFSFLRPTVIVPIVGRMLAATEPKFRGHQFGNWGYQTITAPEAAATTVRTAKTTTSRVRFSQRPTNKNCIHRDDFMAILRPSVKGVLSGMKVVRTRLGGVDLATEKVRPSHAQHQAAQAESRLGRPKSEGPAWRGANERAGQRRKPHSSQPRSASDPIKWLPKQKIRCLPHRDWWLRRLDRLGADGRRHILPHDTDRRRADEIQTDHSLVHVRGKDCWPLTSTLAAKRCRPPPHGCDADSIPELRGAASLRPTNWTSPSAKSDLRPINRH